MYAQARVDVVQDERTGEWIVALRVYRRPRIELARFDEWYKASDFVDAIEVASRVEGES